MPREDLNKPQMEDECITLDFIPLSYPNDLRLVTDPVPQIETVSLNSGYSVNIHLHTLFTYIRIKCSRESEWNDFYENLLQTPMEWVDEERVKRAIYDLLEEFLMSSDEESDSMDISTETIED